MNKRKFIKRTAVALISAMLFFTPDCIAVKAEEYVNPYNSWKTQAVSYPQKGQLVPAGPIEIKWNALENTDVKKYEVYLDGSLQNVQIEQNGKQLSCSVYSTKVEKHQVKILAVLDNDTKVSTSIRNFFVSKKGLGFYSENNGASNSLSYSQNLGLSWYYNWGTQPFDETNVANHDLDYVPMIYNNSANIKNTLANLKAKGYSTVLSFNEPDYVNESNIKADVAASYNKDFHDSGLRIGSPATMGSTTDANCWFENYWGAISVKDDFITIHTYPGYIGLDNDNTGFTPEKAADSFVTYLTNVYEKYTKPIWITEHAASANDANWHPYDGKQSEHNQAVQEYMAILMKKLNNLDFVERYAWFTFDSTSFNGSSSALFYNKADISNGIDESRLGKLTTLGEIYRNNGNPTGYTVAKIDGSDIMTVADEYVDDYVNVTVHPNAASQQVQKVKLGDKLGQLADPSEREGYTFKGWYKDQDGNDAFDINESIDYDIDIYAKYVKLVTVDINGDKKIVEEGTTIDKPNDAFKEGFKFKGWYVDEDHTQEFDFSKPITSDTKIYPYFVSVHTVTMNGQTIEVEDGQKVAQPTDPTKEGYVFKGWYTDTSYTTPFDFDAPITSSVTVYPHFVRLCTVIIDGQEQVVEAGTTISQPTDPTKEGYVFDGWYTDGQFKNKFDFTKTITSDIHLYPHFLKVCTVTINGQTQTVVEGNTINKPADPTKDGYIFDGWYTDEQYTQKFDFTQGVKNDVELYAHFLKIYTVTINRQQQTVTEGSKLAKPADPTKEGFVFKGWYSDVNYQNAFDFNQPVNGDVTLYALFVEADSSNNGSGNQQTSNNNGSSNSNQSNTTTTKKASKAKKATKKSVKTGDDTMMMTYVFGLFGAILGLTLLKRKYE